jgi:coenzyme F420-reducing hydrogenase alpha subunit
MSERRTLVVHPLTRVEGHGSLHIAVDGAEVTDLRLEIFEPPRFFEGFLRGRQIEELPDLVARICGICPAAYQMSVVHALEALLGVDVHPQIRALRRLYYAGEWLESHLLHMMLLAAPDFLGVEDLTGVAEAHPREVERALGLRKLGNRILCMLGGRAVNPVGVRIGGFWRIPTRRELTELADDLRRERGGAEALLHWFTSLSVPRRPQDIEFVALRQADEYPMNEGRIVSSRGLALTASEFDQAFEEGQVPHSTAMHSRIRGRGSYMVGPLARVMLNADRLSPAAAGAFEALRDRFSTPDPAASVFARGIEVLQAIDESIRVIDAFEPPPAPAADWSPRAGRASWVTEAPRGILYIGVETDAVGHVLQIRIVPPTAQNQARIEDDLRELAPQVVDLPEDRARRILESAIREYDPCISCATHFLELDIQRRDPTCASE